jgi:sortase (surface protein transpeptidase)
VDWATGPGVFYDLARLVAGDEVLVTRADGTIAVFAVTSVERYAKSQFPTDQVYGDIDHAGLRLITCGGTWNAATHHYESNTVVYADLIRSEQP